MTVYSLAAVRALAIHPSGLDTPNGHETPATLESIFNILDRLGAIQIDTLQMVARAHYVTLWSRLGAYDPSLFDRLANDPQERRMYEGWFHAVCYLPIKEYRYQLPLQRFLRQRAGGRMSYRELGEKIRMVEGRSRVVMYMGCAVKSS